MSDEETPRLKLPYLIAGQAQKHITHNEALGLLDCIIAARALSRSLAEQPEDPSEGDLYILPADPEGAAWSAWSEGDLAAFDFGAWRRLRTPDGLLVLIADEARLVVRHDGGWPDAGALLGDVSNLSGFGLDAEPDEDNPFVARLNTALFTALDPDDGGDGDLRLTLNKTTASDTASVVFQSGWAGHAEMGLTGSNRFGLKVSPDGSAWSTALSVDPATASVQVPAGSASAPALAVGEASSGLYRIGANILGVSLGGSAAAAFQSGRWTFNGLTHETLAGHSMGFQIQGLSQSHASLFNVLWGASSSGPIHGLAKSRGAAANSQGLVQSGDSLGSLRWYGSDGAAWAEGARITGEIDGAPGSGDLPTRLVFAVTADGAAVPTERMRLSSSGDLQMGGANTVIDASRHHRLRSYTLAALPSASTAGQMIWCSDLGGGPGPLVSDGADWLRVLDGGVATVTTDVDFTVTPLTSAPVQRHTGTLTADRTVTLSTVRARNGSQFRFVRTGGGAFNLSVGGLASLATNRWCEVQYNGAAWVLTGAGSL